MPSLKRTSPPRPWIEIKKPYATISKSNYPFYNSKAWRVCAKMHKSAHPLCINVDECSGAAHTTDHIIPINEGGSLYDWDNLQSLCKSCNASKTGKQAHKSDTSKGIGG